MDVYRVTTCSRLGILGLKTFYLTFYCGHPTFSEKNLSRPPFRFLHDIVTQLIKRTGFFKGLFPDELLDSKNVTEKEQKVKFLQAIIACTSLIHGEELEVRASAIVGQGLNFFFAVIRFLLMNRAWSVKLSGKQLFRFS